MAVQIIIKIELIAAQIKIKIELVETKLKYCKYEILDLGRWGDGFSRF
jgi:hypothetical protein